MYEAGFEPARVLWGYLPVAGNLFISIAQAIEGQPIPGRLPIPPLILIKFKTYFLSILNEYYYSA